MVVVGFLDQGFEFGAVAVEGLDAALLVEVAEIEVVIRIVAHGEIAGGF